MKIKHLLLICIIISQSISAYSNDQAVALNSPSPLKILIPTGKNNKGFPVYKLLKDDDPVARKARELFLKSFISQSVRFYDLAQVYLWNLGKIRQIEPAYLALTDNVGGYAKIGFYINENEILIDKTKAGYIDFQKDILKNKMDELSSSSQIFPHELGHVIQILLSSDSLESPLSNSPDIHYSSLVTDYRTAFSEGFAEHFEVISKYYEPDHKIREGINGDIDFFKKTLPAKASRFDRDYFLPVRIGYYRALAILWYQKLENLKRFDLIQTGMIKYKNSQPVFWSTDKTLLYRNTGVHTDTSSLRTIVQDASTEGVVAAFFTNLVRSALKDQYEQQDFYKPFVTDTSLLADGPRKVFTPLENQYIKIFLVMKNHTRINATEKGQLIDFIEGYISLFPSEKEEVLTIFRNTTGHEFTPRTGKEIWYLNKNFSHRFWVMAQFGLTIPYYSFNINAADQSDLLTFSGIPEKDADAVINYRDKNGPFVSREEIVAVPGISTETKEILKNNLYDQKYVDSIDVKMSFGALIFYPLVHLLIMNMIWFTIFLIPYYFVILKKKELNWKKGIWSVVKQFLKFLSFFLVALICAGICSPPILYFFLFWIGILILQMLVFRKNNNRMAAILVSSVLILLIFTYSLL